MNATPGKPSGRLGKAFSFALSAAAVGLFLVLLGGELFCRIKGYEVWRPLKTDRIRVEPGGSLYRPDPELGYVNRPGVFRVRMPTGYEFAVTHGQNTLRITHPASTAVADPAKPQLWIFGCSFTYGWSLNDAQTYPWILQQNLPDYEVVNFGVGAYSTAQSLAQFQRALSTQKRPAAVILAYASFHDERNTALRSWRKLLVTYNGRNELLRFPYYRLQKGQKVCRFMNAQAFTEFPLSRISALAAFLDTLLIQVEKSNIPSHLISRLLILQFKNACERYRIPFVVAGIDNDALTAQMRMFCARNGIRQVDISQDLNQEGYRNLPHDTHPSALADEGYAKKLLTYLNRDVLESKP